MTRSSHRSNRARCGIAALLALTGAACAGDPPVTPAPVQDPTTLYWQLTLNEHAVTMSTVAPYDTLRIQATPRTIAGTPITDLGEPTYTSLDLNRAYVDSTGLVHAVGVGDQVAIVASLEENNILHADTLVLNITSEASPPPIATFTIHPDVGDSAKIAAASNVTLVPRAADGDGTPISDVAVYFTSSDPSVATIDRTTGLLAPNRPGSVTIYATTTTYGVTKADTLPYIIGHPITLAMEIVSQTDASGHAVNVFSPSTVELGPGATVLFGNVTPFPTDVTFDDPTNVAQADLYCGFLPSLCGTGNIDAWAKDPTDDSGITGLRARRFPVPGTYTFHSTIFGSTGTIVIADEHTP
ncbi:MAG TPA: Ig-like domain-containing protein [Gemmatimonadaceae bacterium]|nr:Ig-like domain-containing protein [Gemmatimonadaceae bacterium]